MLSFSQKLYQFLPNKELSKLLCSMIRKFNTMSGPLCSGEYEMLDADKPENIVNINFIDKKGDKIQIKGKIGDNLLYLAHRYGIELEGACEASLACTTCQVYVDENYFDKIQSASEKEEDLLDMAPGLKENSRLGCQIILTNDLNDAVFTLPKQTRNFYVDGHVPKPH